MTPGLGSLAHTEQDAHTGQTWFETTRREKKRRLIVIDGSLTSSSPVGRTGACGLLGTQTRRERAKRGCGVLGARLPTRLEIAECRSPPPPRPLSSGSSPQGSAEFALGPLKGGACWQPTGCVITWRRELGSPRGLWYHGGSRGLPATEALLPAARPLQPHGGPHAVLVSEPGGIREGGRLKQPGKAVALGPQLGSEMDLGGLSG